MQGVIVLAAEARDAAVLLRHAVRELLGLPSVTAAAYYAADRRKGVAQLEHGEGLPEAFTAAAGKLDLAAAPYDNALIHRQPVFAADFSAAAERHAAAGGFASMACAPVVSRDDVVGALCAYTLEPHDWGPADQVVIPALGRELGAALARLTAERQLLERRLPIQDLFDSVGELLVVAAADGRLLWANAEVERRLGYGPDDWRHMTLLDLHPTGRRIEAAALAAALLDGQEEVSTIPLLSRDGHQLPVETRLRWGTWDGRRVIFEVSRDLTERLRLRAEQLQLLDETLDVVSAVARTFDPDTAEHAHRVARLCTSLARELGWAEDRVAGLNLAAGLHDVGFTAVPHEILAKPGKLTPAELALVKTHPTRGWELVRSARTPWPLAEVILQHHERLDGSGYPSGLRGEQILQESRIVAVADVIEAMSSERPYRGPYTLAEAMTEIVNGSRKRYDGEVVAAAVALYEHGIGGQRSAGK
jgi:PAS domain S-box-containing protein